MKTPMEELFDALWDNNKDKFSWRAILKTAMKKEKESIIRAYEAGDKSTLEISGEQYYNETFNIKK